MSKASEFLHMMAAAMACQFLPVRKTARQPIAYSYNGVVLPGLPEWDKEAYPYAVITQTKVLSSVKYKLALYQNLFVTHDANIAEDNWSLLTNSTDYLTAEITLISGAPQSEDWSALSTKAITGNMTADNNGTFVPYTRRLCNYDSNYALWSNHSFSGPNGEEWITASEPIPVYE